MNTSQALVTRLNPESHVTITRHHFSRCLALLATVMRPLHRRRRTHLKTHPRIHRSLQTSVTFAASAPPNFLMQAAAGDADTALRK